MAEYDCCSDSDYSDFCDEDPVISLLKDINMDHTYCKTKIPDTVQGGQLKVEKLLDHDMQTGNYKV